ncbi:MAG: TraB/GumN family protein [Spirochaetaceae bacterium]|jgi:pheromone shutdown-related protein TraB|nr:TraB/GumN family protein [Spirochaetaceae bacterium]
MCESKDTQIIIKGVDYTITLIGTAHVSKESIAEVSAFINEDKPAMVCVEIDKTRYEAMTGGNWQKLDIIKVFREGKGFLLIANLVLSSFQRRIGNEFGIHPGDEMKTAVNIAAELGIPFSFCDREVQITLRRAWAKCGFWSKCKLLSILLSSAFTSEKLSEEEIENLKKTSELDGMMKELSSFLPVVKETLIDERDFYLAAKIWENAASKPKTVAIIGAGHLTGVKSYIEQFINGETEKIAALHELDIIPPKSFLSKAAAWTVPLLIIAFIVVGLLRTNITEVSAGLIKWLLWNGSLAALGALIALAHPLAILVSFIGAPIGTLSPVISVGLFTGIAQAYLVRPKIEDAETLIEDAASVKGIYRNRITHILLAFFLSSVGGMIGNIISVASLATIFRGFFK